MAYYSKLRPTVYHKYKNCYVGNNVVEENQRKGKPPGARLCKICENLQKGIPGIPIPPSMQEGAEVKTYYSRKRPRIFHICQNCSVGHNIESAYQIKDEPPIVRRRKKPRLCKVCIRLCIAGEGITGTPIPARLSKPKRPLSKARSRIPTTAAASK